MELNKMVISPVVLALFVLFLLDPPSPLSLLETISITTHSESNAAGQNYMTEWAVMEQENLQNKAKGLQSWHTAKQPPHMSLTGSQWTSSLYLTVISQSLKPCPDSDTGMERSVADSLHPSKERMAQVAIKWMESLRLSFSCRLFLSIS